uniref:Uncharacterized protein n=1 Tax=Oryza barthii TaxID=65489 RepID=A0A0D3F3K1_9ORYZ
MPSEILHFPPPCTVAGEIPLKSPNRLAPSQSPKSACFQGREESRAITTAVTSASTAIIGAAGLRERGRAAGLREGRLMTAPTSASMAMDLTFWGEGEQAPVYCEYNPSHPSHLYLSFLHSPVRSLNSKQNQPSTRPVALTTATKEGRAKITRQRRRHEVLQRRRQISLSKKKVLLQGRRRGLH